MKIQLKIFAIIIFAAGLAFTACDGGGDGGVSIDIDVAFESAVETGGTSGLVDSTDIILTFDVDPETLTADNITVTGATNGALTGTGTTRTLEIFDITVADGETVSVDITSPAGYAITESPQDAVVYRFNAPLNFESAVETGGTSGLVDSTGIILTFNVDPETLTADNITVTGATNGALTGTGTTRTLEIFDITVADGETVSVNITSPAGYAITGSPQDAVVYRLIIGMDYLGGKLAYVLQSGDPGYDENVPHGLIVAVEDYWSSYNKWSVNYASTAVPGGTGTAIGTGSENTDKIIAQNGDETTYAAGIARAYDGGGYNDWYLPSKDELMKLWLNHVLLGGFDDDWYWSSSESSADGAYVQYLGTGGGGILPKNTGTLSVRAVRSF